MRFHLPPALRKLISFQLQMKKTEFKRPGRPVDDDEFVAASEDQTS
jgi:hypothetical protein